VQVVRGRAAAKDRSRIRHRFSRETLRNGAGIREIADVRAEMIGGRNPWGFICVAVASSVAAICADAIDGIPLAGFAEGGLDLLEEPLKRRWTQPAS
jgi:hypothetical protein